MFTVNKPPPRSNGATQSPFTVASQVGRLQAISFLFTLSFSLTSLAPAPALISAMGAEKATTILSFVTGCGALTEILFSSAVGSLVDGTGRKPTFCVITTSVALLNALVVLWHGKSVPAALCVSKFFSTLAFSIFALTSQAMLSDMSQEVPHSEKWLSATLGVNVALGSLGFLLGVLGAGVLSDKAGLPVIFGASAALAAVASILAILFLPETLPTEKRTASTESTTKFMDRFKQILLTPLSSAKLLYRHGAEVRILAILLMLLTLPMYLGDMFQVYTRQEWNLDTKSYSGFLALYGFINIFANGCGGLLIKKMGTKRFTLLAIFSRIVSTAGTAFFGYKGAVAGVLIGFLGAAQSIGIIAALVSAGTKSGFPQGELAGERASLMALLKVIGPLLYSFLYIKGSSTFGAPNLPFLFNIGVCLLALVVAQMYL